MTSKLINYATRCKTRYDVSKITFGKGDIWTPTDLEGAPGRSALFLFILKTKRVSGSQKEYFRQKRLRICHHDGEPSHRDLKWAFVSVGNFPTHRRFYLGC
ncbi:hypothetical protein CEXT_633041 [Caerostris extrusa]|uniref:Uncharacterized protein n=1 Tax=Caerostris extrusa TaxID=172846 RepID=A0AAV4MXM8_CAEEX|nr:hypothetical protein CEXT_633041 [Caerostris extrusa]